MLEVLSEMAKQIEIFKNYHYNGDNQTEQK